MKILIVDDDEGVRLLLGQLLQSYGYECEFAENGLEAIRDVATHPLDLVITDYQMPIMNGLEFLESLSCLATQPHPPVVFLSGDMRGAIKEQALQLGATAVLTKPYDNFDLLNTVSKISLRPNGHRVYH